jgi:hypothetical protein
MISKLITRKNKKFNEFKERTSLQKTKRIYQKVNKGELKIFKKECHDTSKWIGNWCTNQKIREHLGESEYTISAEKIYKFRELFLNRVIESIRILIKSSLNVKKNSIDIFPTGSSNNTSDKDVQIELNFSNKYTLGDLRKITNIIIKIRKYNQKYFFKKHKKVFDTYYDINFYMPGLLHFIDMPVSKHNLIDKINKYSYMNKVLHIKSKLHFDFILRPDFTENPEQILLKDSFNIMKNYNMKLNSCYTNYKNKPASALHTIINNIHKDKEFNINDYIFDIVSINNICAEMYMSICCIIYVVWYMQMNKNVASDELKRDLKYIAIPTVIENHLLFLETKKEKYNLRKQSALKHADKDMLIRILKQIAKLKKRQYSVLKIKRAKLLLKELL